MKRFLSLIIAVLCCAGCANSIKRTDFPFEIDGITFKTPPVKVVTLSPSLTETLYMLGYGGRIVGTVEETTRPLSAVAKANCGTTVFLDEKAIVGLAPDLVLTQFELPKSLSAALSAKKIPVISVEAARDQEELYSKYGKLCRIFDGEEKGAFKEQQLRFMGTALMEESKKAVDNHENSSYCMAMGGDVFATQDTLISQIIAATNCQNLAEGTNWHLDTQEAVAPEIIFYSGDMEPADIGKLKAFKGSPAVENEKLIKLDEGILQGQTPALFLEIYNGFKQAYPDDMGAAMPNIVMEMPKPVVEEKGFFEKIFG